MIANFDSQRAY